MAGVRFFSGGRDKSSEKSIAATIMRLEFDKKGKLEPAERFKLIMKMKLEASKKAAAEKKAHSRPMSKKAEKALADMAKKKAVKQAKKMRQMVIVQPQIYHNGRLTKKGKVYDIAGNMVATVNTKNGKMATILGSHLGKYKPKNTFVNNVLTHAIDQNSPYFINLRKMQALQAAGIDPYTGHSLNEDVINVHGNGGHYAAMHGGGYVPPSAHSGGDHQRVDHHHSSDDPVGFDTVYGESFQGPRQNVGATAWGAMSDNVWGAYTDNVFGTSTDTVWGTNQADVWGGVGGDPYGAGGKTVQIWGTGSGKNYMMPIINSIRKLFGIPLAETVRAFKAYNESRTGRRTGTTESTRSRARTSATEHISRSSSSSRGRTTSSSSHVATTRSSAPAPRSGK